MKDTSILICLGLLIFSSCASWKSGSDAKTDAALGVNEQASTMDAEEELERLQKQQREEQRRQLERQIMDAQQTQTSLS